MDCTVADGADRQAGLVGDAPSADAGLVPLLLSISKSSRAFMALLLAEIGLHPGQDQLLHCLVPDEPVSVSVLAERIFVRPSTASKMLDRLIERGFVRRTTSSRDARRTMVTLTAEGIEARQAMLAVWSRLESDLTASLDVETLQRQVAALRTVDTVLSARLRRLR